MKMLYNWKNFCGFLLTTKNEKEAPQNTRISLLNPTTTEIEEESISFKCA